MDPAVATAVLSSVVALATSTFSFWSSRKTQRNQSRSDEKLLKLSKRLDREDQDHERRLSVRAELDKIREPLLRSAKDLQHRICNIRENNFLSYLRETDDHRREVALLGTLHRFARYWALQELLYSRVNLLIFESDPNTKDIGELVGDIARTFATDRFVEGLRLIFWREEQRAVAELMVDVTNDDSTPEIMEFATFTKRYKEDERREIKEDLAQWLYTFAADLQSDSIQESQRLKELQKKFTRLVEELEKGRTVKSYEASSE